MANALNIPAIARRVLAATPTAWEDCESAHGIAARLGDMTPRQVSFYLGRLRNLGLVERDAQDSTWCRYDSAAVLWADQAEALADAEAARPSHAQTERLENFGPDGLSPRKDIESDIAEALENASPVALAQAAAKAASIGQFYRAATLARAGVRWCAGHTRRARLESMAERYAGEARALEQSARDRAARARVSA